MISTALATADPVYKEPLGWSTKDGKLTVPVPAEPWVNRIFTVCPGCILVGLICVFVPFTNAKVKKLLEDKSIDAVLDTIESGATRPLNEPEIIVLLPVTINAGAPYVPITTLSSENTSSIGKPETSFTDISEPDKASTTENN